MGTQHETRRLHGRASRRLTLHLLHRGVKRRGIRSMRAHIAKSTARATIRNQRHPQHCACLSSTRLRATTATLPRKCVPHLHRVDADQQEPGSELEVSFGGAHEKVQAENAHLCSPNASPRTHTHTTRTLCTHCGGGAVVRSQARLLLTMGVG
jgi:hypothetical protein